MCNVQKLVTNPSLQKPPGRKRLSPLTRQQTPPAEHPPAHAPCGCRDSRTLPYWPPFLPRWCQRCDCLIAVQHRHSSSSSNDVMGSFSWFRSWQVVKAGKTRHSACPHHSASRGLMQYCTSGCPPSKKERQRSKEGFFSEGRLLQVDTFTGTHPY